MDRRAKYQKQQAYQAASDKKQGITGGQPGRLYTWSFQMKSFPHRINMVVHMRMLINNSKPRERLIGVNLLADGSDGTDGGIIVL